MIRFFALLIFLFASASSQAEELLPTDSKALYATIPIPNLSDGGVHFKAYLKAIGQCSKGFNCMRDSAREILRGLGWLPDKYMPLTKGQKDWRDLFREQVKFSDEITPEEAEQILEDVEEKAKPLEDEIKKARDTAIENKDTDAMADAAITALLLEKSKAESLQGRFQETLAAKGKTPKVRQEAEKQRKFNEKNAKNSEKAARQTLASSGTGNDEAKIQKALQKEKEKLNKQGDLKGLEHLQVLEDLLKGDLENNPQKVFDAVAKYGLHTGAVKSDADVFLASFSGSASAFLKIIGTKVFKDSLRWQFDKWMNGEGIPGINKPFREVNPQHAPNLAVVSEMNKMKISQDMDCSEIAEHLHEVAGGKGRIINVAPEKGKLLTLIEYGKRERDFKYHQVFTDGKYVYDPRLSNVAVPKGDWLQMVQKLNPGASIK